MLEAGIYELPFNYDLIEFLADALIDFKKDDFSDIAVIFPSRRPMVYLRERLFRLIGKPYIPPAMFQIEEFLNEIAMRSGMLGRVLSPLEVASLIFRLAKDNGLSIVREFKDFGDFAFWGTKLASAFTELDQELISEEKLKELVALSDYEDVQVKIKHLWAEFPTLKALFDRFAKEQGFVTRGMIYRAAAQFAAADPQNAFGNYKFLIFVGFFAMREAEKEVVKSAINSEKGCLIWQSNGERWTPFLEISEELGVKPVKVSEPVEDTSIEFHAGVDVHAEAAIVHQILQPMLEGKSGHIDPSEIAIVLPREDSLMPVLWESISHFDVNFNVSMGYPLKRTPIAGLFELILKAQESRQKDRYYAKDYIHVLMHPYIKNIEIDGDSAIMRIGIQKIDEVIRKRQLQFVDLAEIESEKEVSRAVEAYIHSTYKKSKSDELIRSFTNKFCTVHQLLFKQFERVQTFRELSENVLSVVEFIAQNTSIDRYPFASEFIGRFTSAVHELRDALFSDERLEQAPLFAIFRHHIAEKSVPFEGTPLSGVQILGILETRVLNFKTVVLLDANEGVIPSINAYDPLMPRTVRRSLGLPDVQEQEEVFRYHFTRLVRGAKKAHIIYQQNDAMVRSRFVESLIWEAELKTGELGKFDPKVKQFQVGLSKPNPVPIQKSPEVVKFLENMRFSPSAIDTYLNCPLRFYFSYVLHLKEHDELGPEVQSDIIGSVVHRILEMFYRKIKKTGKISLNKLEQYKVILKHEIKTVFEKSFPYITGEVRLLQELVEDRLSKFIEKDIKEAGGEFEIIALEKRLTGKLEANERIFRLSGRADRIDRRPFSSDGLIFVVDYKTGSSVQKPKIEGLESVLSDRKEMRKLIRSFQLPVYLMLFKGERTDLSWEQLNAELLLIRQEWESKKLFKSEKNRTHFMENIFKPSLGNLLNEIVDPNVPFEPDDDDKNYCRSCPYRVICGLTV